jgi:predicted phosphodiesterase
VRLGLCSDTFGNLAALERALDLFARARAERVFFLGGRLADLEAVLARRAGGSRDAPIPTTDQEFLVAVEAALTRQLSARADPIATRVVRVASRACPEYQGGTVPRKHLDLVDGRVACVVHDKAELSRDDIENATLIMHGNSAQPAIVAIGPRVFVTPGHLRRPAPEGRPATFVLLEAGSRELEMTVFGEDAAELRRELVVLGSTSRMTVR